MTIKFAHAVLGKRAEQIAPLFGKTEFEIEPPIEGSDRRYIEFPAMGLTIVLKNDIAFCLQFFSADFDPEEFAQYDGALPGNVKFATPVESGGIFDLYRIDGLNVHFEYTARGTIDLVSVFNND
jgi:hypothetical protein